jgi:hypothetical protein
MINTEYFPLVYVELTNVESDLDDFLLYWTKMYEDKKMFYFMIQTEKLKNVTWAACVKLMNFIGKMKKINIHYLKYSIIIIENNFLRKLLNVIFFLQRPVARVYLIKRYDIAKKFNIMINGTFYRHIYKEECEKIFINNYDISIINP